jgi:hypothetical protein
LENPDTNENHERRQSHMGHRHEQKRHRPEKDDVNQQTADDAGRRVGIAQRLFREYIVHRKQKSIDQSVKLGRDGSHDEVESMK